MLKKNKYRNNTNEEVIVLELSNITRQAYSEVTEIINLLDEDDRKKIPLNLRKYFEKERDKKYNKTIDLSISMKEQGLKRETIAIIAMLNLNYICNDKSEKEKLQKKYGENERKYQEELSKKYNINNIFKSSIEEENTDDLDNIQEEKALIVKKEKFLSKVIRFFKKIFKR